MSGRLLRIAAAAQPPLPRLPPSAPAPRRRGRSSSFSRHRAAVQRRCVSPHFPFRSEADVRMGEKPDDPEHFEGITLEEIVPGQNYAGNKGYAGSGNARYGMKESKARRKESRGPGGPVGRPKSEKQEDEPINLAGGVPHRPIVIEKEHGDGRLRRGRTYESINTETGDKHFTHIGVDGGRIDFLPDQKWPPEDIPVESLDEERLEVKHGMPWPSLYPALNFFGKKIELRYRMLNTKRYPFLGLLNATEGEGAHCTQCVQPWLVAPLNGGEIDEETRQFVHRCIYDPIPTWRHKLYTWLVFFEVYRYAAAAYVPGSSRLFIFSDAHIDELMADYTGPRNTCLDVGAGLGEISQKWKRIFQDVHCTEVSIPMVKELRKRGFTAHHTDMVVPEYLDGNKHFDCVLSLNVLDRCTDPTRLLDDMVRCVRPGGRLIIAVPMPLKQVQYAFGEQQQLIWPPVYNREAAWEFGAAWFAREIILKRYGGSVLQLRRVARAPYICAGAAKAPITVLDSVVYVLDKVAGDDELYLTVAKKEWMEQSDDERIPKNV